MDAANNLIPRKASTLDRTKRLKTGIVNFDFAVGNGLPVQGVIELTGESGTGKTQLCLQLTLMAQLQERDGGLAGTVVYLSTQGKFPSPRFDELVRYYSKNHNGINFKDNVFLKTIQDYKALTFCLKTQLPLFIEGRNVKLIIIDSITGVFRGDDKLSGTQRINEIRNIGLLLHELSFNRRLNIICTNEVTTNVNTSKTIPALGLAWSNIVTTRIHLSKNEDRRRVRVIYSPSMPPIEKPFEIKSKGLCAPVC